MFAEFSVGLGAAQAGEEQGQREFSVGLGATKAGEEQGKGRGLLCFSERILSFLLALW